MLLLLQALPMQIQTMCFYGSNVEGIFFFRSFIHWMSVSAHSSGRTVSQYRILATVDVLISLVCTCFRKGRGRQYRRLCHGEKIYYMLQIFPKRSFGESGVVWEFARWFESLFRVS